MVKPVLELNNVFTYYNNQTILSNISFSIDEGEIVLLQGSNGEGKTTLIKTILGLLPYTGNIKVKGKEVNQIKEELPFSYLPQRLESIPNITVSDFLNLHKTDLHYTESLKLDNLYNVPLQSLSLGQTQLVVFIQAISQDADIFLLDEPFSSIDKESKEVVYNILKEKKALGKTIILSSHEMDRQILPDRIITLSNNHIYETPVLVKNRGLSIKYGIKKPKSIVYITLLLSIFPIAIYTQLDKGALYLFWIALSGGTIAFSGAILQPLFKDKLASPLTLGLVTNSYISIYITSLFCINYTYINNIIEYIVSILLTCFLAILYYFTKQRRIQPILVGITYTILSVYILFLLNNKDNISYIKHSISALSLFLIPFVIIPIVFLYKRINKYTEIGFDSDLAQTHNISLYKERIVALFLVSILMTTVIAHTGYFILLSILVPYLLKYFYGDNIKNVAIPIFMLGAFIALLTDTVQSFFS